MGIGYVRNLLNIRGAAQWIQGNQTQAWSNSGATLEYVLSISRILGVSWEHLLSMPRGSLENPLRIAGASLEYLWSISGVSSENHLSIL